LHDDRQMDLLPERQLVVQQLDLLVESRQQ